MVITGGWCITCHGSTAHLQSARTCPSAASVYTAVYMRRYFISFVIGMLLFIVRAYLVRIIGMLLFIVRAYLVRIAHKNIVLYQGNCYLVVRTWHHTVFSCHKNSVFTNLHSKKHRFFWWDVSKKATSPAIVYTAVYMCHVFFGGELGSSYIKTNISSSWVYQKQHHQQQALTPPTLKQTSVLLGCIKNSTISSKR